MLLVVSAASMKLKDEKGTEWVGGVGGVGWVGVGRGGRGIGARRSSVHPVLLPVLWPGRVRGDWERGG